MLQDERRIRELLRLEARGVQPADHQRLGALAQCRQHRAVLLALRAHPVLALGPVEQLAQRREMGADVVGPA